MSEKFRILIVDDDAEHRFLYTRLLEEAGYEAQAVEDAEEALTRLEGQGFDLLLTDWYMHALRGDALIVELRRREIPVKAILMSSHLHVRHAAQACSADGCFRKHDDVENLLTLIARLLPVQ
ncbi:MAG TPA: response regulator [Armatimonadota bacterium]